MGFTIIDLEDQQKGLSVNFWNWRPTVELVRTLGVVDAERIELMHEQCLGVIITEAEARQIARGLQQGVLAGLEAGDRVRLDLSTTSDADDGTLHRDADSDKNYHATREWLTKFAQFCNECRGFRVL